MNTLEKLRGKKTVAEVAAAINASPDAYMAYERGERIPKRNVIKLLAEYYGIAEDELA